MSVRAPGKAMLCGEYAVLEGAPAVVAAVGCYARAELARHGRAAESPYVREATRRAADHLQAHGHKPSELLPIVTTDAFRARTGEKYGLGSSAAATVAAAAVLLERAGLDLGRSDVRADLLALSGDAHRVAQGGAGSGADVAASVYGGLLRVTPPKSRTEPEAPLCEPLQVPAGLHVLFVWTGRVASTEQLLARVKNAGSRLDRLGELASTFAQAFSAGDARAVVETARLYGAAMQKLGETAQVAVVTREHALYMELARRHGGSAKPSGAGGGDVGVAFLLDAKEAAALRADAVRAGLLPLDLPLDHEGVRTELPS